MKINIVTNKLNLLMPNEAFLKRTIYSTGLCEKLPIPQAWYYNNYNFTHM